MSCLHSISIHSLSIAENLGTFKFMAEKRVSLSFALLVVPSSLLLCSRIRFLVVLADFFSLFSLRYIVKFSTRLSDAAETLFTVLGLRKSGWKGNL